MSVQLFVSEKSKLLTSYVNGFWSGQISYDELNTFLWDTLEEWSSVSRKQYEAYTHKERIFWHLMQLLQITGPEELISGPIHNEVDCLIEYLNRDGLCPIDVVGMRP